MRRAESGEGRGADTGRKVLAMPGARREGGVVGERSCS